MTALAARQQMCATLPPKRSCATPAMRSTQPCMKVGVVSFPCFPSAGYSFGAATSGVWHHVDYAAMLYPTYTPVGEGASDFSTATSPCRLLGGPRRCMCAVVCCPSAACPASLLLMRPRLPHLTPAFRGPLPRLDADKPLILHWGRLVEAGEYRWQKHWWVAVAAPAWRLPHTTKQGPAMGEAPSV